MLLSNGFQLKNEEDTNVGVKAKTILFPNSTTIGIYLSDDDIPTLVHECFHATSYIMNGIGEEATALNETWAYLIGYLTQEGLKFLKEK